MTFQEKIDIMLEDMQERDIKKLEYAPIPQRWLWKLNIEIRPPFFLENFIDYILFIIIDLLFISFSYNFIIFLYRLIEGSNFLDLFTFKISIVLGVLVVIYNLIHYRYKSKKLDLPNDWDEYIEQLKEEGKIEDS